MKPKRPKRGSALVARVRELEERAACAEFERDAWIEAHGTPEQIAAFSERGRALLDQLTAAEKRAERAEKCLKLHDAVFAAVRDVLGLPITFTYAEAHAAVRRLLKASKETTSENQR